MVYAVKKPGLQRFGLGWFGRKKGLKPCICKGFRPFFDCFATVFGGGKRDRTADLLHAMQALSQLSYTPKALRILIRIMTEVKARDLLSARQPEMSHIGAAL